VDPLPAAPIVNSTSPQAVEVRQSEIAQLKIREDAKSNEQSLQATKADVGIRELMKLGATEIKATSEPQSVSMKTYQEAPLSAPVQDPTTTAPTAQQAAPLATASADTNGQRRTLADDIRLRAMERMVVNAARNGTQTLSIQLYPPGLGQVVLRLAMDGQRLRLATRAATTDAADTLRNMENDLREALAGNGLHLAGFDVSEDGNQEDTQRRQQPEQIAKTTNSDTSETFTVDLNA
jgi:flagellar hook-length control protein FliK